MRLIHIIASLDIGGAEKTLAKIVNKSKNSHLIITIKNSKKLKKSIIKDVIILSLFPIKIYNMIEIFKSINRFNPDIFQGWMYHGDLLASIFGLIFSKPVFWNIRHGKMSLRYSSKITILIRFLLTIISYFSPKIIISCSRCGIETHQNIGYSKNKFCLINNGYFVEEKPNINYKNFNKKNLIKVASIGRNSPQKNRSYFIDIVKIMDNYKNIQSYIYGHGVKESKYLNKFKEDKNIKLTLENSKKNIQNVYSQIDILIVTSIYGEGFPNVIIEAMRYGVLVFSTDVGDAKYILGNKKLIIPNNDYFRSAKQICNVIDSDDLEKIVFDSWKRSCELFDEKKMVEKYDRTWNNFKT